MPRAWLASTITIVAALWLPCFSAAAAAAPPRTFGAAALHAGVEATPPDSLGVRQTVELPRSWPVARVADGASALWIRIEFDHPHQPVGGSRAWAVYLPDLATGGQIRVNGSLLEEVQSTHTICMSTGAGRFWSACRRS